jgi:hypothetical protein
MIYQKFATSISPKHFKHFLGTEIDKVDTPEYRHLLFASCTAILMISWICSNGQFYKRLSLKINKPRSNTYLLL